MTLVNLDAFTAEHVRKGCAPRFLSKTAVTAAIRGVPLHVDYRYVPRRKLMKAS